MADASWSYRLPSDGRPDYRLRRTGHPLVAATAFDVLRGTQAVRGAVIGALVSLPLWIVTLATLAWMMR